MRTRRGNGEGTIYRRSDGRWEGRIDLGYVNGRRVRRSVYGRTRREVQEKLRKALSDVSRGLPLLDERTTVGAFLEQWLETVRNRIRPTTYRSYEQVVRVHLIPFLGAITLAKLQPHHVHQLVSSRLERGLSPRTADYCRVVLRAALNDALKWGLIARNVASLADPPRQERRRFQAWDVEEARRFLEAVRGDRLEALYAVALALGLRQGEALGLTWANVDLDRGVLRVTHQLQWLDGIPQLVEPKSTSAVRVLRLPALLAEALRRHRIRQREERLAAGPSWRGNAWGLVFTTQIGTPLDPKNLRRWFRRACLRAGVRPIRFHDLRHTCATLLLAQDIPARVVQEILGHSNVTLTLDTYTSVLPRHLSAAAERIDTLLSDDHCDDQRRQQRADADGW
jgi:integrase